MINADETQRRLSMHMIKPQRGLQSIETDDIVMVISHIPKGIEQKAHTPY